MCVSSPTTSLFVKGGYYANPSVIPPWQVDGSTADTGGSGNNMGPTSKEKGGANPNKKRERAREGGSDDDEEDEDENGDENGEEDEDEGDGQPIDVDDAADAFGHQAEDEQHATSDDSKTSKTDGKKKVADENPKVSPPPLHVGGSDGTKGSHSGAPTSTAAAIHSFTRAYETQQGLDRAHLLALQTRGEEEGKKEREHMTELATGCKQQ